VRFLDEVAAADGGTFLVYRDELPPGEDVTVTLHDAFGAGPGDRVVRGGREPVRPHLRVASL
jgi:hypothetical protein